MLVAIGMQIIECKFMQSCSRYYHSFNKNLKNVLLLVKM